MSTQLPDPKWTRPVLNPTTFEDARTNLEHTLQIFHDSEDERNVLMSTSNIYGDGIRTGLSYGDLRLIARHLGCEFE